MACTHTRWVYDPPYEDDWTGEWITPEPRQVSTSVDIDIGRFRCAQCGEVGYYTGLWRDFHENGIPCPGSDGVRRVPPNVRANSTAKAAESADGA